MSFELAERDRVGEIGRRVNHCSGSQRLAN